MGWETDRLRLRRRVGHREHARGALRRHAAQGDLRHHRAAHDRALLRRLGLRRRGRADAHARRRRLRARACRWAATCAHAPAGKAPTFLVAALKDPIGANLDRIQIIKGWLDAKGELQEKVYDVVWSGDRKPGADGKLPPVGNTVDVANATWTNTIGAPELITVVEGPGLRPGAARLLLRARASRSRRRAGPRTTPSASASRCRQEVPMIDAGARLHLADLVHAVIARRGARGPSASRWCSFSLPAPGCSWCGRRRAIERTTTSEQIVVGAATIQTLAENWTRVRLRPPTAEELDGLVDDHVREEVYYREALALGLDRDDTIIRRRLRQKLEFLSADLGGQARAERGAAPAVPAEHPDPFRRTAASPGRTSF